MSADKAELRAEVIQELGNRLEDLQEASLATAHRADGAEEALNQGASVVQSLHEHVDKEMDSGVLDPATASHVKRWITRAVHVLQQMVQNAHVTKLTQHGHAQGMKYTVDLVKKIHGAELRNAAALRERDANRDEEFGSIKEQRLAEEAAQHSVAPPVSESVAPESVPPSNGTSVRPRRRSARRAENGQNA